MLREEKSSEASAGSLKGVNDDDNSYSESPQLTPGVLFMALV